MNFSIKISRAVGLTIVGFLSQFVSGLALATLFSLFQPAGEQRNFYFLIFLTMIAGYGLLVRLLLAGLIAKIVDGRCSSTKRGVIAVVAYNAAILAIGMLVTGAL